MSKKRENAKRTHLKINQEQIDKSIKKFKKEKGINLSRSEFVDYFTEKYNKGEITL